MLFTEGVLRMKITDYAIISAVIMLSFFSIYFVEDDIAFNNVICYGEMNKIIDNITISSLDKGYTSDIGKECVIDREIVAETFLKNVSLMLYGYDNEYSRGIVERKIMCMFIVDGNQYYLYKGKKHWEEIEFKYAEHEKRVDELEKIVQEEIENKTKNFGYRIMFPKNQGEHNRQTIRNYSFIVIYDGGADECTGLSTYVGQKVHELILSGAVIR